MKRPGLVLMALSSLALVWSLSLRVQGGADDPKPAQVTLPGARPTIEAIHFPSLQAALDVLPEGGGVVQLPAGTFEINEPLVLSCEDVLLRGSGTATLIKNVNEDGKPALIVRPSKFETDPKAMQWRVKLADFRIIGNPKSGHGIEATNVNELFLDGVTVSYHGGDGVHMTKCTEDARICNSLITYNKVTGLHLIACHDIVVSGNQFEENQDALRCIDSYNLCMTGNCLDDHLRHGVVIENTYGSVVSGNMIEECDGTGIILDRDCYGITLSANVIAHEQGGGIDLRGAHGCAVSANTFTIIKQDALLIGPNSGRITVTGNNFSDSTIGNSEVKRLKNDRGASGLTLDGTSDVAISGNLFSSVKPKAIKVTDAPSQRILVSGNVLTDVESDHAQLRDSKIGENLESESR
ncbi:MAG: right-handed parallel beta-helix repeat-containing protein [Isosphaeraceae bacterium]